MSTQATSPTRTTSDSGSCAICQSPLGTGEEKINCPDCGTAYHTDCWSDNRGCGVYGCPQVPPTDKLEQVEIPVSYWGQEEKPCPVCGNTILAAAVRCRNCGATFDTAKPQATAEFTREAARKQREPALRTGSIWLLIVCVIPFLAPLGAIFGGLWYRRNREELAKLPGTYRAIALIGLIVAVAQTIFFILLGIVIAATSGM